MSGKNDDLFMAGHDASRIGRLAAKLREDPENRQLRLQLANAMKRQRRSEEAFRESLGRRQIDVVDYRIVEYSDRYALLGISESLISFQRSLTAVYDAVSHGPKEKAKYSEAIKEKSRLFFDYAYPGSRGFMLSVVNEQDLLGGDLDQAIETFYEYSEISSTDDAIEASRKLGLAAISELYKWIKTNSSWGYGIDYNWIASSAKTKGRFIDNQTFSFIKEVFDGAEEREETVIHLDGILVGLDVETRRFHIAQPEGDSIKGLLDSSYSNGERTIPHRYRSIIKKVIKKTPATGKSTEEYYLMDLVEI